VFPWKEGMPLYELQGIYVPSGEEKKEKEDV
jgi:hypothetical protein